MKKKIIIGVCAIGLALSLAGCNKKYVDFVLEFDKCIISLPNGEIISGEVQNWKDYEGEQIQVKVDGKYYVVHSSQIVLIKE